MPLRATLLYLSRHGRLRAFAEHSRLARRISSRFIAGSSLEEALAVCRRIKGEGITATLDYLGENVKSLEEAAACRDTYIRTLHALRDAGLEPNVSLKLTQFGIDFSLEDCERNVDELVRTAAEMGGFVRIDMEGSAYTERTLGLVRRVHARHGACGTVIQAYLRRSDADLTALTEESVRIRLCKGAYLEPPSVAFPQKPDVDRMYVSLAQKLLIAATMDARRYPALATHDERILGMLERFAEGNGVARDRFEFQMLYGIRRDLQERMVADGYRLRLYVPFGEAWYPYFMRRLAERPANLLFLLRNLIRH